MLQQHRTGLHKTITTSVGICLTNGETVGLDYERRDKTGKTPPGLSSLGTVCIDLINIQTWPEPCLQTTTFHHHYGSLVKTAAILTRVRISTGVRF